MRSGGGAVVDPSVLVDAGAGVGPVTPGGPDGLCAGSTAALIFKGVGERGANVRQQRCRGSCCCCQSCRCRCLEDPARGPSRRTYCS